MSIAGQVWRYEGFNPKNRYYIVEDRGRVSSESKWEYSYLLVCLNDGKKIEYLIDEPIQEHGSWKKVA